MQPPPSVGVEKKGMSEILEVVGVALTSGATVYAAGYTCGWAASTFKLLLGIKKDSDSD